MNNYTWQTLALYTTDVANQKGYVVNVRYNVIATDNVYNSKIELNATFEEKASDPNYIPYDKLTNSIVMGWCQEQLGADGVQSVYDALDQQIENQVKPPQTPTSKPLPF